MATRRFAPHIGRAGAVRWRGRTRTEIDLSRREVEEAHRPVIVPVIDETRTMKPLGTMRAAVRTMPSQLSQGWLTIPVEYIGSGPALDLTVSITPRPGPAGSAGAVTGLGIGQLAAVSVRVPNIPFRGLPNFDLRMTYLDVAGKEWVTSARYMQLDARYVTVTVGQGPPPVVPVAKPTWPRVNGLFGAGG